MAKKGDLEELKSERTKADLQALGRARSKAEMEKRKRRDADRIARWDEFGISHIVMEIERRGDQAEPITFSTRSLWMKEPIRSHVSNIIFKYVDDAPRVATGEFRVKIKEMFKSNYIKGSRYVPYVKSEISTSDLSRDLSEFTFSSVGGIIPADPSLNYVTEATASKQFPEDIKGFVEYEFEQLMASDSKEAKQIAERILKIAEERKTASSERRTLDAHQAKTETLVKPEKAPSASTVRNLGLREAARLISSIRDIKLHPTMLRRYFDDKTLELGGIGPRGEPLFSRYECETFVPPLRPRGRPRKKS